MINALNECISRLSPLIKEITRRDSLSYEIKWLVTSRNELLIRDGPSSYERPSLSSELNSTHVSQAVDTFILTRIAELARIKRYDSGLKARIEKYLSARTNGTFLWVALVCKELESVPKLNTLDKLGKFPAGLGPSYERILAHQDNEEHPQRHLQIC
jgi:hypothetical protein